MKGNAYAAETLEILKELARHLTVTIEFADAVKRDSGEDVFRIYIKEFDYYVEETFEKAIRTADEAVDNFTY